MSALASGCYYASCGPVIKDCRLEAGVIRIATSPVVQVTFYCDGAGGGQTIRAETGKPLTTAQWAFQRGKRRYRWIRAEVVDQQGNHAWTNPFTLVG
jgi:hypothetical protein